jgi:hypothetical protein
MTITYGFYDSISSDRLYNAKQMGSIFDGLILDGVYANYGDHLEVLEDTGMDVTVGTGRSWFNHTWTYNDALIGKTIPTADALLHRIDIVYLEVDESVGTRANSVGVLEGTPASSPVPPTLTNTETIHQYALAHIFVGAAVTEILQADITDMVGTDDTPFVELVVSQEALQAQIWAIVGDTNPPLIDILNLKAHNHDGTPTVQIDTDGLVDEAVEAAKIAALAVISSKLGTDSVIAGKIADGGVVAGNIANGAVNVAAILGTDVVETAKIKNQHVTTDKIKNLNITAEKMAALSVGPGKLSAGAVADGTQMASNIVSDNHLKNRVLGLAHRQGSSMTDWSAVGAGSYTPQEVRMEVGAIQWTGGSASAGNIFVTFPTTFGGTPVVFAIAKGTSVAKVSFSVVPTEAGVTIYWKTTDASNLTSLEILWQAVGPE